MKKKHTQACRDMTGDECRAHHHEKVHRLKKRHPWGFYPMFVITVAAILTFSMLIGGAFIGLLFYKGFFVPQSHNPLPVVVLIALPSLLIGLLIVGIFGGAAVRPLTRLSKGLKEVASGNFTVRLDEDDRGQFGEVNHNFNVMAQELESIEMLREDFIVNVSHEFKSPLSSIQGYATLLQDPALSEDEREEYLEAIFSATRSLANMSSNILELSNLETQTSELLVKEYSLDEQIRQVIVMLEPISSEKGIALDIELEDTDIVANQEMLETVWINLLGNSIKFTEPGERIAVTLKRKELQTVSDENQVEVSIADTGCGMNEDELSRIFDKFYQADTSHKAQGNGLGLSLVRAIIKKHMGSIEVASISGEGSTFTVRLPLTR